MKGCVKIALQQIKEAMYQTLKMNMPISFEYCIYEMSIEDCETVCHEIEALGFDVSIGHRLGSENTIIVKEKE